MKLKDRILISNTITISICLIMLLLVFHMVTDTFRKNFISEIVESIPKEEQQVIENDENIENITKEDKSIEDRRKDDKPKDINVIIKQKEVENFYIIATVCIAIAVIVILLVSQIFTKKIFSRIVKPVDKLMEANERVKKGDYENLIEYKGEYEFEQLCDSFNKMQTTLKEEREREVRWQKTKQDMISGISHDLKTPLTSIKGYVKGIIDGVANTREKEEKYLDIIYKKACDMDALIERLLYFSRVENGQIYYQIKKISAKKLIEQYIKGQEFDFREKGIEIVSKIKTKSNVNVDIMQMNRVFSNIIQNSIKYAQVDKLKIEFNVFEEENNIKIEIKDNGKGIAEEKIDKIFDEFYRIDESRTNSNIEGNGIGLYVCKYIIEKHKGSINAKNDNGLKIIIILPKGDE